VYAAARLAPKGVSAAPRRRVRASRRTDHRGQVCTALTKLVIEPPAIEVWDLAREDGCMLTIESTGSARPSS
jgi:hypothetical protein